MNGTTVGTYAVVKAVSPSQGVIGTGDWIVIGYLTQGVYSLKNGVNSNKGTNWCNIAVNGVLP